PRGKLKRREDARAAAEREVVEETGHRVAVKDYLGAITYSVRGQPKIVQFWRMQAAARPSRDPARDISAVVWLPLPAAVQRLSFVLEKLFLRHVGRRVLRRKRKAQAKRAARPAVKRGAKHASRHAAKLSRSARKPRRKAAPHRTARVASASTVRSGQGSLLRRMFSRLGR